MDKFDMKLDGIHLVLLPQNRTNGEKFYAAQMNVNALDVKTYKGFAESESGGAWAYDTYEDAVEYATRLIASGIQVDRVIKIGYGGWEILGLPLVSPPPDDKLRFRSIKGRSEAINHPDAGSW